MHKLLIPIFLACLFGSTTRLSAQVPFHIPVPKAHPQTQSTENLPCNAAGSFQLGPAIGQTNDIILDTIYLCLGDSVFINHNGNFDLSGDPNPATPPGVGYAFYTCPPTVAGDNVQAIAADPCVLPGATDGLFIAGGTANGDTWFFNNGNLQTLFGTPPGEPVQFFFAPITLDRLSPPGFESNGGIGGPCVNVNVADAFSVVYLNEITSSGISGSDCVGTFSIRGGMPEWISSNFYTVSVTLDSDPSVQGLVHNQPNQIKHGTVVTFSAPLPGLYNVTVEDGKSCGHTFQIDMTLCSPDDNVVLEVPDLVSPPNSTICVPVTVQNFNDVATAAFSLEWDETVLQYQGYSNVHDSIPIFTPGNLNATLTAQGLLGMIFYNANGDLISIVDNDTLIQICFTVIGELDSCSDITFLSNPTGVGIESEFGTQFGVTANNGQVCIDFLPLTIVSSVVDTTCNGMASIQVTAFNGHAPYDVIIQQFFPTIGAVNNGTIPNSGSSLIEPGLFNGSYSVCVTDSNGVGVTVCDTLIIDLQILGAALDLTQTPSCNGLIDGTVTASVFLGTTVVNSPGPPQFSFNWNPATVPSPNGPLQSGVGAGTYAVTVTDNTTGCTAVASGTLGQPGVLNLLDSTLNAASCPGICDGSITYRAKGGTTFPGGAYNYNWEYRATPTSAVVPVDNITDSVSNLTDLCAGTYFLTVTDINGCIYLDSMELFNARSVEIQLVTQNNPSCPGASDGLLEVQLVANPPFTNGAYSFFWAPPGFPQMDMGNVSSYKSLYDTVYSVLAVEAGTGCVDTATFVLVDPDSVQVDTLSYQQPTCEFQDDGALTVFAVGGTGFNTYTYNWDGPTGMFTGQTISGLVPGTYCVTATDGNGCTDTACYTLFLPPPPAIVSIDSTSVKCGDDGQLEVLSPSATTFIWTTLAGDTIATTAALTGLAGGTYIITLIDADLCINTDTVTLDSVTPINIINVNFQEPTCNGYDDGTISFGAEFGNPPYTFRLDSVENTSGVFNNVTGGQHIAVVTDSEGCSITDTLTLDQPPGIGVSQNNITPATCFSTCDGSVTLDAYYATVPPLTGIFTYSWDDGGSGAVRNDLCAGVHTVTITDANNCFITTEVTIGSPAAITASLDSTATTCAGDTDGSATISVDGGSGSGYTYLWCNGTTTATVTGLPAGPCGVTVTDAAGCTEEFSVEIVSPDPIVVTEEDRKNPTCFGKRDGEITVSAAGGNAGGYTFMWDSTMTNTTGEITDLGAGNYSVTVTDAQGCTGVLSNLNLIDPSPLVGTYHIEDTLECFGDETQLIVDTIYGGSGSGYLYSLDNNVAIPEIYPSTIGGGDHILTFFDQECELVDTIHVDEPAQILVNFNPPTIEIELGDSFQLQPVITISGPIDSFLWSPVETLINPDSLQPYAYPFQSQVYSLTVIDTNGCVGFGEVVVEIDPNRNVYIPNAFMPGNDINQNDHFTPLIGRGVRTVKYMRVYDRWGSLLYEQNNFLPQPNDEFTGGWDGRFKGKFVNPGVYVYIIEVEFLDDRVLLYRGDVTVVR